MEEYMTEEYIDVNAWIDTSLDGTCLDGTCLEKRTLESMSESFRTAVSKYWKKREELQTEINQLKKEICETMTEVNLPSWLYPKKDAIDSTAMANWLNECYCLAEYSETYRPLLDLTLECNEIQQKMNILDNKYYKYLQEHELTMFDETHLETDLVNFISGKKYSSGVLKEFIYVHMYRTIICNLR